jgi:hypothetical protein
MNCCHSRAPSRRKRAAGGVMNASHSSLLASTGELGWNVSDGAREDAPGWHPDTKKEADPAVRLLEALRDGNAVTAAAAEAGLSRQAFYLRRNSDDAFAAEWDEAVDEGTDVLEDVAFPRAITARTGCWSSCWRHGDPRSSATLTRG